MLNKLKTPTLALGFAMGLLVPGLAQSTTINVDALSEKIADDGTCTLREAINSANINPGAVVAGECEAGEAGEDTIMLPAGSFSILSSGNEDANANGDFDIFEDVRIIGDSTEGTVFDAVSNDRIFHALTGVTLTLENLTLQNGFTADEGGAIRGEAGSIINVSQTTFRGNSSTAGGGAIATLSATLNAENSTFSQNSLGGVTAASVIYLGTDSVGNLVHNTFDSNQQILVDGPAEVDFSYNILGGGCDVTGTVNSSVGNLATSTDATDCSLGSDDVTDENFLPLPALASNGGPTQTIALPSSSPALDAAVGSTTLVDQRGLDRALGGSTSDIGAFEVICGDGFTHGSEECDDGDTDDTNECSNACTANDTGTCGNGINDAGEECDDGDLIDDNACSNACTANPGFCGNGIVEEGESCDDGNNISGDGCENTCLLTNESPDSGGCSLGAAGHPSLWLGFLGLLSLAFYRRNRA